MRFFVRCAFCKKPYYFFVKLRVKELKFKENSNIDNIIQMRCENCLKHFYIKLNLDFDFDIDYKKFYL